MKHILLITILTLLAFIVNATPIIDVTKIAGKSQKEVATYLGKETACAKNKYGKKCTYKKDTEIVFINGKADWITINHMSKTPFTTSALLLLGLKEENPSFKNSYTFRWERIQDLRSISIFKGASTIDYIYIQATTK